MNYEKYMRDAAEFRRHMEEPISPFYTCHPREWKESEYLPGGEAKSIVPEITPGEDLSHMNSKQYHTLKARGKTTGRRKR